MAPGCSTLCFKDTESLGAFSAAGLASAFDATSVPGDPGCSTLYFNEIGCAGAAAVASALVATGAPKLERLTLHNNRISTEGFKALTEALKKPAVAPKLKELRVDDQESPGSEDAGAREAKEALKAVLTGRGCSFD